VYWDTRSSQRIAFVDFLLFGNQPRLSRAGSEKIDLIRLPVQFLSMLVFFVDDHKSAILPE
jgi:hypothetical protein